MTVNENILSVTDYDALLAELWNQPEDRVDFKEPFRLDLAPKKQICGLAKDIMGMSNRAGGGFIVIGKKDSSGEAIDCDEETLKSFEVTKVHDKVRSYGKPEPTFTVYSATSPFGTRAIIIHVKEFTEVPVICAHTVSFNEDKGPPLLREGAVYIRTKTGSARTCEVPTEQEMRDLIDRAVLKGGKKLTTAFDDIIARYLRGNAIDPVAKKEAARNWQKEQEAVSQKLETLAKLSNPILQITAHPDEYEQDLFDPKTLQAKLGASAFFHRGWSFPCPDFEIAKGTYDFNGGILVHTGSKRFLEGELLSAFGLSMSGLMIYKEELTTAYDKNMAGKPLLIMWVFLTIYRAVGFLAKFFDFSQPRQLRIGVTISDTYQRVPCSHVYLPLDHPMPFFKAKEIKAPKISLTLDYACAEIINDPEEVTLKIAQKIIECTDAEITEGQLEAEIAKIAAPS